MNISQKLAAFTAELTWERIPRPIQAEVPVRVADYLASACAGAKVNRGMNAVVLGVLQSQGGQKQCSLLFCRDRLSAVQAAYYNAFVCNGADMDDGHMLANGHPGVCVIPGVLALAEWRGLAHGDVAAAIVAGYEVFIRLAGAMAPSHLKRGFNGTGTAGTIAAAAACARVLGLDADKTHTAMGLAATSASGLMELNESGQAMKPINPAKSASHGVMCALLAEAGAVGPDAPLDGSKGYIRAFSDEADCASITEGLGQVYRMDTTYIKLYPACRHMHAMADCAAKLFAGQEQGADAQSIWLCTYPASEKLTGLIRYPASEDEAKFSLTYAAAVALKQGNFTLEDLYGAKDMAEDIRALIDKMEIVVCPELEDRKKMIRGARMELVKADGTLVTAAVDVPKGEKTYPLGEGDLLRKLSGCAAGLLKGEQAHALYQAAMSFGPETDITQLYALTAVEES